MNKKIKVGHIEKITSAILLSSCALLFSIALSKPSVSPINPSISSTNISAEPQATSSLLAPSYTIERHATSSNSNRDFIGPAIAGADKENNVSKALEKKLPPSRAVGAIFTMPVLEVRRRNHQVMT
jgi:hypothetical protein